MVEGDALHCCKIEGGFTDLFLSSLDHTVDSNSSFSGSREGDADWRRGDRSRRGVLLHVLNFRPEAAITSCNVDHHVIPTCT
jgi:hypothetical protein